MLERIGIPLDVQPAEIDEGVLVGEAPEPYVRRIAREKAMVVASRSGDERWVLAADTTVTIGGAILGKAESPEEATAMLGRLSARTHQVLTAFVLRRGVVVREVVVSTDVVMVEIDDATLADYVASGEWRGKAGAYAIQGIGAALVREIRGSVTNVIGLPMAEVIDALREVGGPVPRLAAGDPS
ncbi:MAG: maf protein [Deltaproteobacteria bacterium]|nr:maf protein [Deltaproteobacteria bacterium]